VDLASGQWIPDVRLGGRRDWPRLPSWQISHWIHAEKPDPTRHGGHHV